MSDLMKGALISFVVLVIIVILYGGNRSEHGELRRKLFVECVKLAGDNVTADVVNACDITANYQANNIL